MSAAEITAGCALPRSCAVALALPGWVVGDSASQAGERMQSLQSRECFKENLVHLFTVPNVANDSIFNYFLPNYLQSYISESFNSITLILR